MFKQQLQNYWWDGEWFTLGVRRRVSDQRWGEQDGRLVFGLMWLLMLSLFLLMCFIKVVFQ